MHGPPVRDCSPQKPHSAPASPPVGEEGREMGEGAELRKRGSGERVSCWKNGDQNEEERKKKRGGKAAARCAKTASFRLNETASFLSNRTTPHLFHTDDMPFDHASERQVV